MRILSLILLTLLIATTCFARTDVLSNVGSTLISGASTNVVSTATLQLTTTSTPCIYAILKSNASNKTLVYVGDKDMTTTNGYSLVTSEVVTLNVDNLNKIYIRTATDGGANNQILNYIAVR